MPDTTLDDLTTLIAQANKSMQPDYAVRQVYLSPDDHARLFAEFRRRVPLIEGLHERTLFIIQGVNISRRKGYYPGEIGMRFAPRK